MCGFKFQSILFSLKINVCTHLDINGLYINLYIKKQHIFLLRNDKLNSIYIFQIELTLIWKI